ncbi:MAG: hypothetical protein BPH43C_31 [Phage 5P_1]|nr:MAG: hypothetical protein BPH43C_31 [Phage 5P_1]
MKIHDKLRELKSYGYVIDFIENGMRKWKLTDKGKFANIKYK